MKARLSSRRKSELLHRKLKQIKCFLLRSLFVSIAYVSTQSRIGVAARSYSLMINSPAKLKQLYAHIYSGFTCKSLRNPFSGHQCTVGFISFLEMIVDHCATQTQFRVCSSKCVKRQNRQSSTIPTYSGLANYLLCRFLNVLQPSRCVSE